MGLACSWPSMDRTARFVQFHPPTATGAGKMPGIAYEKIRTIEDCHRDHLGPALLRHALDDSVRDGYLSPAEAAQIEGVLLPGPGRGSE